MALSHIYILLLLVVYLLTDQHTEQSITLHKGYNLEQVRLLLSFLGGVVGVCRSPHVIISQYFSVLSLMYVVFVYDFYNTSIIENGF